MTFPQEFPTPCGKVMWKNAAWPNRAGFVTLVNESIKMSSALSYICHQHVIDLSFIWPSFGNADICEWRQGNRRVEKPWKGVFHRLWKTLWKLGQALPKNVENHCGDWNNVPCRRSVENFCGEMRKTPSRIPFSLWKTVWNLLKREHVRDFDVRHSMTQVFHNDMCMTFFEEFSWA